MLQLGWTWPESHFPLVVRWWGQIWMLTGDKEETAKNIGYATRMLNADQHALEYSSASKTPDELRQAVAQEAAAILKRGNSTSRECRRTIAVCSRLSHAVLHFTCSDRRKVKRAMVIDDKSLDALLPPGSWDSLTPQQRDQATQDRRNLYIVANECAAVVRGAPAVVASAGEGPHLNRWLRLCRSAAEPDPARRLPWCSSFATATRKCARWRSATVPTMLT